MNSFHKKAGKLLGRFLSKDFLTVPISNKEFWADEGLSARVCCAMAGDALQVLCKKAAFRCANIAGITPLNDNGSAMSSDAINEQLLFFGI